MKLSDLMDRLLAVRRVASGSGRPVVARLLTIIAALAFLFGSAVAIHALELNVARVDWSLIFVVGAVGVPLTALVNAWEYATSAHVLDHRPSFLEALRVSIIGTAANLLPIPGATLVRLRGLRGMGAGYRSATLVTTAVGLIWIGVSAVLVGAFLAVAKEAEIVLIFLVAGVAMILAALMVLSRAGIAGDQHVSALMRIIAVEIVLVGVNVFRQSLVLAAIGVESPIAGAVVLVLSAALAAAAGVFPGGLGLREILSAALAPVAGVSAAAGFVAAALNRIVGAVGHAVLALLLGALGEKLTFLQGSPTKADLSDR